MGIDYSELEAVPGTIPKPKKRQKPPKEPKKRKSVNRRNEKRAKATRQENFGPQADACWLLPCFACGREGHSVPHHDPTQKNGGTDADAMPLCCTTRMPGVKGCHQRVHEEGRVTFWTRIGSTPQEAKEHTRTQAGITIYG